MIYATSKEEYSHLVTIQTREKKTSLSKFSILGVDYGRIDKLRERVRTAITKYGFSFPKEKIEIFVSPSLTADESCPDLAVALSVLSWNYSLPQRDDIIAVGNLDEGKIVPYADVNSSLIKASDHGIKYAVVPDMENLEVPKGMLVCKAKTFLEAVKALVSLNNGDHKAFTEGKADEELFKVTFVSRGYSVSLDDFHELNVNGMKWAMTVAVAGRHHLLMYGSAGNHKSSVASRINQLLPRMSNTEISEVQRIYSMAGMDEYTDMRERKLLNPLCTFSIEGMFGGGTDIRPGYVSLAHRGVLLLDEVQYFKFSVLQMLRVPLDTKSITLARGGRSITYPADFQLVMTANSCPCGCTGSDTRECICSEESKRYYWNKLSDSLLDKVAIKWNTDSVVNMGALSLDEMHNMIKTAWERQLKRQGKFNAELSFVDHGNWTEEATRGQLEYVREHSLRTEEALNLERLCLTVADMFGSDKVTRCYVETAIKLFGKVPTDNR